MAGGVGAAPLTYAEISAWATCAEVRLSSWEARTLRRMSCEYVGASHAAEDEITPAPWMQTPTEETRKEVSKKIGGAFRMLIDTRPKR